MKRVMMTTMNMAVLITVVVMGRKIIESQQMTHHLDSRIVQVPHVTLVPVNERLLASMLHINAKRL